MSASWLQRTGPASALVTLAFLGCVSAALSIRRARQLPSPWLDVTESRLGATAEWSHRVELADLDADGRIDLLFANGGDYDSPGVPELPRVFRNEGPEATFRDVTREVLGDTRGWFRAVKVRDVNGDGRPDVLLAATYRSQSRLYLGQGGLRFADVTSSHLPAIAASAGDLELGDVDGDGDLDIALADWGPGDPMNNGGGRTRLWLNDGSGHFSDATADRMPERRAGFSWDIEFVDVDGDFDLDLLVACRVCDGSLLFENDGRGYFRDVSDERLPRYANNYDFEAIDLDGDGDLDLVTLNDGPLYRDHVWRNDGRGFFSDATSELWPASENPPCDDNAVVSFDYDSDGDSDLLIGSLSCPDRVLENDGAGHLKMTARTPVDTRGTLGIAVADLDGDGRFDVVEAQGEKAFEERIYFGRTLPPDRAAPVIARVEALGDADAPRVRARVHDHKIPALPHDFRSVSLLWRVRGEPFETPMQWIGEALWVGSLAERHGADLTYWICATDGAGNRACSPPVAAPAAPARSRQPGPDVLASRSPARVRRADGAPHSTRSLPNASFERGASHRRARVHALSESADSGRAR